MQKICADFVAMWEKRCYQTGLPDEVPHEIFDRAPSYRLVAHAILKNDVSLLGIVKKPCKAYIRLKRKEFRSRGELRSEQLELEF